MRHGGWWDRLLLGPQRRRRQFDRQWREYNLAGAEGLAQKQRRSRSRRRAGGVVAGGLAVASLAFVVPQLGDLAQLRSPHAADDATRDGGTSSQPLGVPPKVRRGVGTYSFVEHQPRSRSPVAYDPCREIEYAVNDAIAPPGGDELIEQAVREMERATGLVFVRRPDTDEHADFRNGVFVPDPGPVVIEWTSSVTEPELLGFTLGLGGSAWLEDPDSGQRRYISGAVALDTYQLEDLLKRPNGPALVQATVMHELGHVLGLDHVKDRGELMFRHITNRVSFGPGDREGLAALGAGRCF